MRLLFAITVCCFLAVLWIALALARRIRLAQLLQPRPLQRTGAAYDKQEFFEAGEFRTPRPLRLEQEILQQKPRRPLSEISFSHNSTSPVAASPAAASETVIATEPTLSTESLVRTEAVVTAEPAVSSDSVEPVEVLEARPAFRNTEPIPIRPVAPYASLFGQTVQIARIDSHLRTATPEILAPDTDTPVSNATRKVAPVELTLHRRPPMTVRTSGLRRRIDLSHYNKDMGDLTDPYTTSLRGSGTQGPAPKNRGDR